MKKQSWIISFISIVIALSGCSSKPTYGAKFHTGSFLCFPFANYEYQNYEARLYDASENLIATADNLEVKESTGSFSTGFCDLSASFIGIPFGKGPYKIEYLLNRGRVLDTWVFETLLEY